MNIEGFGDLPDGFSLADEPLRQFCLLSSNSEARDIL